MSWKSTKDGKSIRKIFVSHLTHVEALAFNVDFQTPPLSLSFAVFKKCFLKPYNCWYETVCLFLFAHPELDSFF